ncbi:MAG TPA: helix-turn-helix transcriptional regulator [Trebonia sp.]|nr:helix-turn-helix transcriptional regulator [Trebonia sp.]
MPRPNSRDPESDPAAAFGDALRRLREAANITTQGAAGKRQNYSHHTISRWETGAKVPDEAQINDLLDDYGVTGLLRDIVMNSWRLARKAKGPIREFFAKYFAEEQQAAFLRLWGVLLIPGPLQTREYAYAMFRKGELDEEEAAEQADLRMRRRARVTGEKPAHVTALIYERALYYQVGTPETMIDQLADLLELSRRGNVVLQVIRDEGYFTGARGSFGIASGPGMSDIVDQETVQDYVADDPDVVSIVVAHFEVIRGYARNMAESQQVITEAIQWWESQQKQ